MDIFNRYKDKINNSTIFVWHSIWVAFILRVLESLNIQIKWSYLISWFARNLGNPAFDPINKTFLENGFDWDKINKNCEKFTFFHSDNDPYVPIDMAKWILEKLSNTKFWLIKWAWHFNTDAWYTEFKELYDNIKTLSDFNYDQALIMLNKYITNQAIINHCIWVSIIAFDLAIKISTKRPWLNINPKKIKIAWLLHDIGKHNNDNKYHELNSVEILKKEGLNDIAHIVLHWFVYEQEYLRTWIKEDKYLPINIENKIISLSDMYYNQNMQKVTLHERFEDIRLRYKNNTAFISAVNLAEKRYRKLEEKVFILLK